MVLITLPIGNLEDITERAKKALVEIDVFFAEDTRVFKDLLNRLGISFANKKIDSFHDHSSHKVNHILGMIKNGIRVGVVSDAGSPIISDPAYPLIQSALEEGIAIKTRPGVSSVLVALELSGLPSNPFHFWGFLGRGETEKIKFFNQLKTIKGTHIFFESPHRIEDTVNIFFKVQSDGELVVARELTKKFEEVTRLTKESIKILSEILTVKGEFVLLYHQADGKSAKTADLDELKKEVTDYLEKGNTKKLAKILATILDCKTQDVYQQLLK